MGGIAGRTRIGSRSRRRQRSGSRWRPRTVALGLLLGGLGVAAVGSAARDPGAGSSDPPKAVAGLPSTRPTVLPTGGPDPETVFGVPCGAVPGWPTWRRCRVGGVAVAVRSVAPGGEPALYVRLAGPSGPAAEGGPECAAGRPEERSWARAAAPARPVGRYRCRIERGRAVLWWSDPRGLVARADAPDGDLARLFAWWTRHAGA